MTLSRAYATAVAQFRALRIEQEAATNAAALEAEAYGATFMAGEIEHEFAREGAAIASWTRQAGESDEGEIAARKKWRAIVDRTAGTGPWTRGTEYQRLWREGQRPDYRPLTQQLSASSAGGPEFEIAEPPVSRFPLLESASRSRINP
jgi:small subunit ribosomal protein S23